MKEREVWYFAYGSNLNIPQMLARVGEWKTSGQATFRGWKLVFNVPSSRWGGKTANILNTNDPCDIVCGAIYLIIPEKLDVLTSYEGVQPRDVVVESQGQRLN